MDSDIDSFSSPDEGLEGKTRHLNGGNSDGGAAMVPRKLPEANVLPGSQSAAQSANDEADEEFERKWVGIARNIVARTKHDPFLESEELNKASKEYRKQLNSRGISLGEE